MNNWETKKLLTVVLAIQIAMLVLVGLGASGFDIPVLRQVVGFIYLAFIPGALILRILRFHKLNTIETLLYSVGLSIALLMFLGFLINMLYPHIGISRPLSTLPLIATMTAVVLILCLIAYKRDRGFSAPTEVRTEARDEALSLPPILFLILLPVLSVLSSQLAWFYHDYTLYMVGIALVSIAVLLASLGKFIPPRLYGLAVAMIAISILLPITLSEKYLIGWDIQQEYYLYKLVEANAVWDSTSVIHDFNTMLSVTILPTIFSTLLNMEGKGIFRIVIPLLFCLTPLAVYELSRKQTNDKIGFLSALFYVIVIRATSILMCLTRQEIAILFWALLMLLFINKDISPPKRTGLFITFSFAMIVSHYTMSYLFMFFSLAALAILYIWKHRSNLLTYGFVILFTVMCLSWYMYNSEASPINTVINAGYHVYNSLSTELFAFHTSDAMSALAGELPSPLHAVNRGFHLLTQFLIVIGALNVVSKRKESKFSEEYIAFSLAGLAMLLGLVIIPFGAGMSIDVNYPFAILFLAPFCILGGELILKQISKVPTLIRHAASATSKGSSPSQASPQLKIMSLLLVVLLLLNTGFVYRLVEGHPSEERPYSHFTDSEITGALWLLDYMDDSIRVYSDINGRSLFTAYRGIHFVQDLIGEKETMQLKYPVPNNVYIYLIEFNIRYRKLTMRLQQEGLAAFSLTHIFADLDDLHILDGRTKIYSNGSTEVYR